MASLRDGQTRHELDENHDLTNEQLDGKLWYIHGDIW